MWLTSSLVCRSSSASRMRTPRTRSKPRISSWSNRWIHGSDHRKWQIPRNRLPIGHNQVIVLEKESKLHSWRRLLMPWRILLHNFQEKLKAIMMTQWKTMGLLIKDTLLTWSLSGRSRWIRSSTLTRKATSYITNLTRRRVNSSEASLELTKATSLPSSSVTIWV